MLAIPNTGKDAEQQENPFFAYENAPWSEALQDSLTISYKSKHNCTRRSSNSAPTYLSEGVEDLHPHKNVHMNDSSSFITNY